MKTIEFKIFHIDFVLAKVWEDINEIILILLSIGVSVFVSLKDT